MEGGASSPDGNSAFHDHVIAQICREARLADAGWSAQHHRLPFRCTPPHGSPLNLAPQPAQPTLDGLPADQRGRMELDGMKPGASGSSSLDTKDLDLAVNPLQRLLPERGQLEAVFDHRPRSV